MLVGETAKRQMLINPSRTIRSAMRHMGTPSTFAIDNREFTPQQLIAFILKKLHRDAEDYLCEIIAHSVITVPACFDEAQQQAISDAARLAGLGVREIITEPEAAARAYRLENQEGAAILVFDLGSGTLDVSLLEVRGGAVRVEATRREDHLGGDDWDRRILDWLVQDFKNSHGIDLSEDKMALQRLAEAAERAKAELSGAVEIQISVPYIAHSPSEGGSLHLESRLTRAEFQQMTLHLLDRCRAPFQQVIEAAGIDPHEIDHVVLAGGSTHMPAVIGLVTELTAGKEPHAGINPGEVVAIGASRRAAALKSRGAGPKAKGEEAREEKLRMRRQLGSNLGTYYSSSCIPLFTLRGICADDTSRAGLSAGRLGSAVSQMSRPVRISNVWAIRALQVMTETLIGNTRVLIH